MDLDGIGYARHLREQRARVLANVPASHRARILGRPAPYAEPKRHEIVVNLKTGERTVKAAPVLVSEPKRSPVVRRVVYDHPPCPPQWDVSQKAILAAILTATEISAYEYFREGRSNIKITRARQMGYWLTKRLHPGMSLHQIGAMFRKDHSTILKGLGRGEALHTFAPICEWLRHPAIVALLGEGERP